MLPELRRLIDDARAATAAAVNTGLTMLYWRIGRRITEEILKGERAEYFYAEMCRIERWSVRVLRERIDR